jgi:hypothetical protein
MLPYLMPLWLFIAQQLSSQTFHFKTICDFSRFEYKNNCKLLINSTSQGRGKVFGRSLE